MRVTCLIVYAHKQTTRSINYSCFEQLDQTITIKRICKPCIVAYTKHWHCHRELMCVDNDSFSWIVSAINTYPTYFKVASKITRDLAAQCSSLPFLIISVNICVCYHVDWDLSTVLLINAFKEKKSHEHNGESCDIL